MNSAMINIPAHTKCQNCGACCGPVPCSPEEYQQILTYVDERPEVQKVFETPKADGLTCPFRDEKKKVCSIYPVRPLMCRLFGVARGMACPNGNTCDIDYRLVVQEYSKDGFIMLKR